MRSRFRRGLLALVAVCPLVMFALPQTASAVPKWSIQETPSFPKMEAVQGALKGVSCTSSESCVAVGYYVNALHLLLAERWNGKEWSPQELPSPDASVVVGVSCSSSEACTAVGHYQNSSLKEAPLAERWNGKEWSIQETKTPTGATSSSLSSVSCSASEACTAVGHYKDSSFKELTLAERWNGKEWSIQETKTPTGAKSSSLSGVSCSASEACTAVGHYVNSSSVEVTLAERWNGKEWSIQETVPPTGAKSSSLSSVSCAPFKKESEACTAVGQYVNSSSVEVTLAEHVNGKGWSIQETVPPTGAKSSSLSSVSCASSEACSAVGNYVNSSSAGVSLAESWNGLKWTIHSTPNPMIGESNWLYGVSCTSSTACAAVGTHESATLAEQWNGTKWSVQTTPSVTGSVSSALVAVSCTSSTACTAVGHYYTSEFKEARTLAEVWNGTEWKVQTTPNPEVTHSYLEAVSCTSSTACTATGSYEKGSNNYTLAERWNGTEWKVQTMPNPVEGEFAAQYAALPGVSCTSSTSCTASGGSTVVSLKGEVEANPLAERWNGTEWKLQTVPKPLEKKEAAFQAISCTSSEACTGVGQYNPGIMGTGDNTLAERWNGTAWKVQTTPNPSGESFFHGVSCASATACTAAGVTYVTKFGDLATLAEAWNGTEWLVQTTPNPSEAHESNLFSTSCPTSTVCVAVGNSRKIRAEGASTPLVERYE